MSRVSDMGSQQGPVSNRWSCSTLQDGLDHVAVASGDAEDELLKEIQDLN